MKTITAKNNSAASKSCYFFCNTNGKKGKAIPVTGHGGP
jgi:hypothetical protein